MLCCTFQSSPSVLKDRFSNCWGGWLADNALLTVFTVSSHQVLPQL